MARTKIDYGIDLGTTNSAISRMENGEAIIKKTAARQSQEAFVLADRSKLKQRSFVQVLSLKQAMILTDNCPKDYLKTLKKHTKVTEV